MTDAICLCGKVIFLKGRHATLFIHLTSINMNVNENTNVTPESKDHVEKFFILLRSRVFTKLQIYITLRASFTKRQISMKVQFQNSADGRGNVCEWSTNNAQVKEHRRKIEFSYRPTQYQAQHKLA